MSPAQLNPPQLVSPTHFSGRPAQRWARPAASAAIYMTAGRPAAASTASDSHACQQPTQLRYGTAVQLLRGGRQHPGSLQHSRVRQKWSSLQVTAAAGALQPPIAGETLTQLAARFMGYAVLVGSCFRSTPQIARIMKANSARGVSLVASLAELVAYSITCAYNLRLGYAFSTYGEVAACWVQDIILVALISRHMRTGHKRLAIGSAGFAVYCWWLTSRFCSISTLTVLQASTISMVALGGRLPQIVLNIQRGDSGELSITTSALNLAGNLARAFTTVVLTHDALLLLANAVQACLNAVLLYQTAMTAVRRRQHRRRPGDTADLDAATDDEDAPEALSPAALEAAEEDAEADNDGSASAAASSVALAEAADSALGDGGFGSAGGSAMLMEPPPSDFMDLAGGGGGGGGGGQGTGDF